MNFQGLIPSPVHATFTRWGGVSSDCFAQLNVGRAVGDDPQCVNENLRRVGRTLGLEHLAICNQVHGNKVAVIEHPPAAPLLVLDGYDAMISPCPGLGLLMAQADCQAVMLYDAKRRVAANIHAGWRGLVAGIIPAAIRMMSDKYSCHPGDLHAAISPSLGPCCAEFVNHRREFPPEFMPHMVQENHFDLPAVSTAQLISAGLRRESIEWAGICTRCSEDFFSYRRNQRCGRFCSVIAAPRPDPN